MAYCSLGNVVNSYQLITYTATSQPPSTAVTIFCDEISLDMDAVFQTLGITVPVTDADALKVLRNMATNGVIAKVLRSIEAEVEVSKMYQDLYDKAMTRVVSRPETLGTSPTTDSPSHQSDMQKRSFKMGERSW